MIEDVNVEKFINESMLSYSAYVLINRALPDFRDGMKPVQRKVLFSMKLNGTTKFTKSATVTGRIMEIHPHSSAYGSVVGLVQKDKQSIPLLDGKGSWGQFTSKNQVPAADRYTEVKLGKSALEAMKELKENSVDYVPNYDGTIMMPEVLPVTVPLILTQAQAGIGVGFASETLSYNLLEIRDVIKEYLETGKIKTLVPDFATGAYILDEPEAFDQIMKTGQGSIKLRARAEIIDNKIIVNQIPYGIKREQIISKIVELNKQKKLPEVIDVRDGTSFTGMKIVITLKKSANPQEVLEKLYYMTPMQSNASANTNILFNGYPTVMGIEKIITEWIKWREQVIRVGFVNKIKNMRSSLSSLKALEKVLIDIDMVIKIIRFEEEENIEKKLMSHFGIDADQANYISSIKLRNLNEAKIEKQISEIKKLESDILDLESKIDDITFLQKELLDRMDNTIKVLEAPQRKTEIMKIGTETKMEIKKIIKKVEEGPVLETSIHLTKAGYLITSDKEIEDISLPRVGDEIIQTEKAFTNSRIILFLPDGKIGTLKANDFKDSIFLPIQFDQNPILGMLVEYSNDEVIIGFDNGKLSRIAINNFIINRKITENGYATESKVNFIKALKVGESIKLKAISGNKEKVISPNDILLKMARQTKGNMILKPKDGQITTFEII